MTYEITLKSGKVVTLHNIGAVDYCNNALYYSDGEETYSFDTENILTAERVMRSPAPYSYREGKPIVDGLTK